MTKSEVRLVENVSYNWYKKDTYYVSNQENASGFRLCYKNSALHIIKKHFGDIYHSLN
jgi:hypothetical protein